QLPPHAGHFLRMSCAPSSDFPLIRRSRIKRHPGLSQTMKRSIWGASLRLDTDTPVILDRQYGRYTYISHTATGKPESEGMPDGRALGLARVGPRSESACPAGT